MSPQNPGSTGRRSLLDDTIRAHVPKTLSASRAYLELIGVVRSRSRILAPNHIKCNVNDVDRLVLAMSRIARFSRAWIRSVFAWNPNGESGREQFYSLVEHLFVRYEIPRFLANSWFEGGLTTRLFVQMGRGKSVRKFRFPISMTKSMARYFMSAPDDVTVLQALRWSQVRSLGGPESLARAIVSTRLAGPQRDERFWLDFLRMVINGLSGDASDTVASLDRNELNAMIQFAHAQKFVPASHVLGYQVLDDRPLQPDFQVKGRSVRWLRRRMANWQNELELPEEAMLNMRHERSFKWQSCGIGGFRFVDGETTWTITEILNIKLLRVEGGIMQHCVAIYGQRCRKGSTTIWSLQKEIKGIRKRQLTIEVWPEARTIIQAKGKRNSPPTPTAQRMLARWVSQEGLQWPGRNSKS